MPILVATIALRLDQGSQTRGPRAGPHAALKAILCGPQQLTQNANICSVTPFSSRSTQRLAFLISTSFYQGTFAKLVDAAARIMSMFGSTYMYVCQLFFSSMKLNKSALRSRLTDEHLRATLRLATAHDIKPNLDDVLVSGKRCQLSSQSSSNWHVILILVINTSSTFMKPVLLCFTVF